MKNGRWKTAYHNNARSNIGAYKTDLKAKKMHHQRKDIDLTA